MRRLALLALAACAACGSLSKDPGARPVLATIHGELSKADSLTLDNPSGVRVAVVWFGFLDGGYSLAEDLPVQPVFPSAFKIDLNSPPPDDVMVTKARVKQKANEATPEPPPQPGPTPTPAPPQTGRSHPLDVTYDDSVAAWPDDFAFAIGAVVAYVDLNQNGKLDLVDEGASAYVDQIAGANDRMILAYFQGSFPQDRTLPNGGHESQFRDGDNLQPPDGYDLFLIPRCTSTDLGGASPGQMPACAKSKWLGMDTTYELPMTSDPKWGSFMCKNGSGFGGSSGSSSQSSNGSGGGGSPGSTPPGPPNPDAGLPKDAGPGDGAVPPDPSLPPAGDPNITCSADGRSYSEKCTPPPATPQRLCGAEPQISQVCGGLRMVPNPPPPNWPCTIH
jgi:hypothetical protein